MVVPVAVATNVGWLPILSLSSACGLLLLALAFSAARMEATWASRADALFWAGLLALFVPSATRLIGARASRYERIVIVALFGLGLYAVKWLQSPVSFTFHDEFIHWRTALDILQTGQLFNQNPVLPISALFPGLEIITTALSGLSGLSIFAAGVLVLAAARVVLVLGLYLLYEQIGGSARLAGLATLLYMVNPKLIYFDAQFSYESLALPLGILVLYVIARRMAASGMSRRGLTLAALLAVGAMTVTHHLTTYAFAVFLALWALMVALVERRDAKRAQVGPSGMAIFMIVVSAVWLVYVAAMVVSYIAPHVYGAMHEVIKMIQGELAPRVLFRDQTGEVEPLWERVASLLATLLILLALPWGLYSVWRYFRTNATALTLALVTLVYPATLALRFTTAGGEASDRAAGTLFVAIAFVLAAAIIHALNLPVARKFWVPAMLALVTVVFVGEIIVGAGPRWARLPGPYLVGADARSVEPEGISAATWARSYLGTGNRIATDRINSLLMITYGEQRTVNHAQDNLDISPLFVAPGYGPAQRAIVEQGKVRYVVVDRRLSTALPRLGIYYEAPEANALNHTTPIDPAALAKFDRLTDINRLFDSGDIVIYEIGIGAHEP